MRFLVMAAALTLGACGAEEATNGTSTRGPADTKTATVDFDPCSVLSGAEVTAITTDAVIEPQRREQTCIYRSSPNDGLELTIYPTGGVAQMKIVRDTAKLLGGMGASVADQGGTGAATAELLKPDATAAPKLGDEAVWGMNTTLSVRKGGAFVQVTPPLMHDPATHSGYPIIKEDEKRAIAQKTVEQVLAKLAN